MQVYRSLEEVPRPEGTSVVLTIGFFDGVHIGHRRIINRVGEFFDPVEQITGVVSFASHPAEYFAPEKAPKLLTTRKEKIALLNNFNLSYILMLPFEPKLVNMPGRQFIEEVLVDRLGVREMVVGYDTRFGKNRDTDAQKLVAAGRLFGFKVEIVQPVRLGTRGPVSSTAIRGLLVKGDVQAAESMLGRPYSMEGKVVRGLGLGRKLGVPTANIETDPVKLIPANGVYATRCSTQQGKFKCALNIGVRPTIPQQSPKRVIEAHLIGFDGDIVGQTVTIEFARLLRPERKFSDLKALVEQMKKDIAIAEKLA
jgi:riboflavin kinase / FMN adenylyltransferase